MSNPELIAYRRFVASFARQLSAEEVEQIAFIRIAGKENVAKYNAENPSVRSGHHLLLKLEHLGIFSLNNLSGLIEIAKDVERNDLNKKVEEFTEARRRSTEHSAKPAVKKRKPREIQSEEYQRLEEVHHILSTKCVDLEKHATKVGKALKGATIAPEEASRLLRASEDMAEDLLSSLRGNAREKRSHSSSSCSNGSDSSEWISPLSAPTEVVSRPSQKPKPVVKKRALQPLAELVHETSMQETYVPLKTATNRPQELVLLTRPQSRPSLSGASEPPVMKPVPPRKNSAKTAELQAVEDEGGRDSGLWTSSNSEYDQVEDWRKHIKNPPPDPSEDPVYQSIAIKKDHENEYATLQLALGTWI